jgi:hypothetical protein
MRAARRRAAAAARVATFAYFRVARGAPRCAAGFFAPRQRMYRVDVRFIFVATARRVFLFDVLPRRSRVLTSLPRFRHLFRHLFSRRRHFFFFIFSRPPITRRRGAKRLQDAMRDNAIAETRARRFGFAFITP